MNTGTKQLFACGALLIFSSGHAAERGPGWEAGAELIYQDAQPAAFEGGSSASLQTDYGWSLNATYRFNARFEVQFALDWQEIDYKATLRRQDLPNIALDVDGSLEAYTPRVAANYNFMDGPLTPYVTAAIGWTFVDTNIPDGLPQNFCWWDPWWGPVCAPYQSTRTFDDFVYDIGVGARWDISPGYSLRLAYERHWTDYDTATSVPDFDQVRLGIVMRF